MNIRQQSKRKLLILPVAALLLGTAAAVAAAMASAASPRPADTAATGVSPAATTTTQPGQVTSLPAFSSQLVAAINNTDVTVSVVTGPPPPSATVPLSSAVSTALLQLPTGSQALAAQLVTMTTAQYPDGLLVWAVQTLPKGGYFGASAGPAGFTGTVPPRNFDVEFVNATSGQWVEGLEGYSAGLG